MSLPKALEVGVVGSIDLATGMLISGAVEVFAPPITNQTPVQLLIEGTVQFLAVLYLSLEGTKLFQRTGDRVSGMLPYGVGLFVGAPNTTAKLSLVAAYARQLVKGMIFRTGAGTAAQSVPVTSTPVPVPAPAAPASQ